MHSLSANESCAKAKPKPYGEDVQGLPLEGRLSPGQRLTGSVDLPDFSGKIISKDLLSAGFAFFRKDSK